MQVAWDWPRSCFCGPYTSLRINGVHHARATIWVYHQVYSPLDNAFLRSSGISAHVQSLLHWCIQKSERAKLVDWSRFNVLLDILRLLWLFVAVGQLGIRSRHHRNQHGDGHPPDWGMGGQCDVWRNNTDGADSSQDVLPTRFCTTVNCYSSHSGPSFHSLGSRNCGAALR